MPFHNIPPYEDVKIEESEAGYSPREQTDDTPFGLSYTQISANESGCGLRGTFKVAQGGRSAHLRLCMEKRSKDRARGGEKGKCKGFSRRSRKEMMYQIGRMDLNAMGKPLFGTLTYPAVYSDDPKRWKRDLDVLRRWIDRKWPEAVFLWRIEPQKRGAPHYHFLIWDGPVGVVKSKELMGGKTVYWMPKCQENEKLWGLFGETWARIVGGGVMDFVHAQRGTRLEVVQTENGVVFYVSKYMSKAEKESGFADLEWGRPWGIRGRKRVKWRKEVTYQFSDRVFYQVRRVMRKWLEKKMRRKFRIFGRDKGFRLGTIPTWVFEGVMGLFWYQEKMEAQEMRTTVEYREVDGLTVKDCGVGELVYVRGYLRVVREVMTRYGKKMAYLQIDAKRGKIEGVAMPYQYFQCMEVMETEGDFLVYGEVQSEPYPAIKVHEVRRDYFGEGS